ncbi:C6 transcription factor [Histoplasma capsulatum var. duboisii H88]|uniref:C6 transcription factor n=1 Tax=Ajellomyces capsulatus (strain H88) TaxID=544711 RepID=F0UFH6_AJEC8|nr:C6 transcription factor [Histoplasma capsulatum var. duboisii H88]QSS54920.1 C6 transcription factor [Histoplasma capsulatum var. duboisii H88]
MPENTGKPGVTRKSAFSCEACRKRKVKCNGANPSCSRCTARGETCVYSLTPTLSYTKTLEARVAELEATIAQLRGGYGNADDATGPQNSEQQHHHHHQQKNNIEESQRRASGSIRPRDARDADDNHIPRDLVRGIDGLKVGDDGRISLYGPTSLFQLPSSLVRENTDALSPVASELDSRKERLINNAWRERAFEQLTTIPDPFQHLLDSHWCWVHPLFNFVYRPAFTRDMKLNGPYFSEILLNAIVSHSMRWCKNEPKIANQIKELDCGNKFLDKVCFGLFNSLKAGNGQIPIVQSLLLLSAEECGRGNRTQAWLYSGMAFRLVEDLGITIDSRKYSSVRFSDEDIEIRNRLFWTCYFWDKLVSLYFGRSPIIQDTPVSPPRILLDDTAEIEIWTPHGVVFPEGTHYPPTQSHATSCFMKMCSLTEILNQIIIHIYDPVRKSTEAEFQTCLVQQSSSLERWWDELPVFLKLIIDNLPPYSPPSHIVTLNCIYHTTNILLHRPALCSRPFRGAAEETHNGKPLVQCVSSATSILALYDLYRRTFGDGHVLLSMAYSIYTAASIFLLEIQALRYASPQTLDKLRFCVAALNRVTMTNPVIKTALNLIEQELAKLGIDIRDSSNRDTQHISLARKATGVSRPHSDQLTASSSSPSTIQTTQSPLLYTVPPHGAFSFTPPPLAKQREDDSNAMLTDPDPSLAIPDSLKQEGMYEIAPELFEAFSYVDPLSTTMGGKFETGWGEGEAM